MRAYSCERHVSNSAVHLRGSHGLVCVGRDKQRERWRAIVLATELDACIRLLADALVEGW